MVEMKLLKNKKIEWPAEINSNLIVVMIYDGFFCLFFIFLQQCWSTQMLTSSQTSFTTQHRSPGFSSWQIWMCSSTHLQSLFEIQARPHLFSVDRFRRRLSRLHLIFFVVASWQLLYTNWTYRHRWIPWSLLRLAWSLLSLRAQGLSY